MDDPLVHCPFNLAHSVKQSRLQKHLIKCKLNHPESKLEPCPYNATEYIHPDDLVEHLKVCRKAVLLEGQKYTAELLKENYLDAPFHIPKPKIESEDFEDQEIRVDYKDEQILERSVSQMSINTISDVDGKHFDETESSSRNDTSSAAQNRASVCTRSSLRSVGRGYAMAGIISVLQQIDEMDYTKYEIRSTVTDKKSEPKAPEEEEDPEFAPPEKFGPVRGGNISLFERKPEADNSKFEDCSSDQELEACDNISDCSSEATIIETSQRGESPKLSNCPRFASDSEDEDDSNGGFNSDSRCSRNISQNTVSNGYQYSASHCSFMSLTEQNKLQNDFIVRRMEDRHERNFVRGKPSHRGQNHSFNNQHNYQHRYHETAGSRSCSAQSSAGVRGMVCNSTPSQNFSSNRGGPHRSQNRNNQSAQIQSRDFFNTTKTVGRGSLVDNDSRRANSAGRGNSYQENTIGRGNFYNQGDSNRGSFIEQNFVGRRNRHGEQDLNRQNNSAGRGNSYNSGDSVGRGNFYQQNSMGRGNSYNQHFQENSSGRENCNQYSQENSVGSRQIFNSSELINQNHSLGRGKQLLGRGSLFSQPESSQGNSMGRGSLLMKNANMSQAPSFRSNSFQQNGFHSTTNFVDQENFRGKSRSKLLPNANNNFKNMQISDCPSNNPINEVETQKPCVSDPTIATSSIPHENSKESKPKKKRKKKPKQTASKVDSDAKLDSNAEGSEQTPPDSCVVVSSAVPESNTESAKQSPSSSGLVTSSVKPKSKTKKKTKTKKSSPVDPSTQPKCNTEDSLQTLNGPGFKILDKQMDLKKYFGSSVESKTKSKDDFSNCNPKSDENILLIASKEKNMAAVEQKDEFEIYDQFYDNLAFGPFNNKACMTDNKMKQNKNYQAPKRTFSERIKNERHQANQQKVSVNFIQISKKPEQPKNFPLNALSDVNFTSLHQPQKPQVSGRYDNLSKTASHKFVFRQTNKKKVFVNQKFKPVGQGKKLSNPPSVRVSQCQVTPANNVNNIVPKKGPNVGKSAIEPKLHKKKSNSKKEKGVKASVETNIHQFQGNSNVEQNHVKNQMSLQNVNSSPPSANRSQYQAQNNISTGIQLKHHKNHLNFKNKTGPFVPSKTSNHHSQMNNSDFKRHQVGNKMSPWSKNSYCKMNNRNFEEHQVGNEMSPWSKNSYHRMNNNNFEQHQVGNEMSLWSKKSYRKMNNSNFEGHQVGNEILPWSKNSYRKMNNSDFEQHQVGNEMSLWSKNSYRTINSSFNTIPAMGQKKTFNSGFAPSMHTKKHSFVVPKKNSGFYSQGTLFSQNMNFSVPQPQQNPEYRKKRVLSSMFANSFIQPIAFGPSISSHLQYSSRPLDDNFDYYEN